VGGTQLIITVSTGDVSVGHTHTVLCCCVQVCGSAPTAHGLISEAFLGTAAPDTAAAAAAAAVPGIDNLAAGLDMVARWVDMGLGCMAGTGGWGRSIIMQSPRSTQTCGSGLCRTCSRCSSWIGLKEQQQFH
jgi:hypothetical protein